MPVRNRTYENLLQFFFGGMIVLAIIYAIAKYALQFFAHLLHQR